MFGRGSVIFLAAIDILLLLFTFNSFLKNRKQISPPVFPIPSSSSAFIQ